MGVPGYHSVAVIDVEHWSSRSAVDQANIQGALTGIMARGAAEVDLDWARVPQLHHEDGAILAVPDDVAKKLIADGFVAAMHRALLDHNLFHRPSRRLRIRLSLHTHTGNHFGAAISVAIKLADSAVMKRVLAAACEHPLALIVSRAWHDAVINEGHASPVGYEQVWVKEQTFAEAAWVKVPGMIGPPGLMPGDLSAATGLGDAGDDHGALWLDGLRARADAGDNHAARRLADLLMKRGDLDGLRARADAGDDHGALRLAELLEQRGDLDEAVQVLRAQSDGGSPPATWRLVDLLERRGDLDEAVQVLCGRADAGDHYAAIRLADLLERRGDLDGLRARADAGDDRAARRLADLLMKRGDLDGLRARADAGDHYAAIRLADLLERRGDLDGLRARADAGDDHAAARLADLLMKRGDLDGLRARADAGDDHAAARLADLLMKRGDLDGLRARADAGDDHAARRLADLLMKRGDLDGLRARADAGDDHARRLSPRSVSAGYAAVAGRSSYGPGASDPLSVSRDRMSAYAWRARGPLYAWVPPERPRYLVGQCPENVAVGKPFSLLASINVAASLKSAELEPFDVPSEGLDVVLVMYAPGLHVLSDHQQTVHVPADADSRPVRFELRADTPGPAKVSITAWIGGTYLGELGVEITAERDRAPGPAREVLAEITTQPTAGAVSLVVRYDPSQQAYRFEFRDEDNPDEVSSNLAYDPGPKVERLIADLDSLAAGRSGYSADQTRDYLVGAGARLWRELVPGQLREQFWDRQHRIRQLTILADKDVVPWELLYPMDPGHDAGFLVEQFPVARGIFGWRPGRTLRLQPARFVLPEGSLQEAADEVEAIRRLLDRGQGVQIGTAAQAPSTVISELTPLTDLIGSGKFGLLHFACHNTYEPVDGSSIRLGRARFTLTLLEVAAIQKALQASAPTVFINACRSAGLAATYNRLDGWASKFLEAGAAAFIGSLWAVSEGASREFAQELYRYLKQGSTLGNAVMKARQAAAKTPDDPTWLAYTVYGDPRATISRSP